MRNVLRVIAFLAVLACVVWIYSEPNKFDPWVAFMAALLLFLGLFVPTSRRRSGQKQVVESGGSGIQAGRDVKITIGERGNK